jgi:ABC-type microcin C transport system permease subunit YejB
MVLSMKTLAFTGGTKIEVTALNALVAKPFHSIPASITHYTSMSVPTCEKKLSHFASMTFVRKDGVFS